MGSPANVQLSALLLVVRDLIAGKGVTVEGVAAGCGLSAAELDGLLRGHEVMHVSQLHDLAQVLGTTAGELLRRAEEQHV